MNVDAEYSCIIPGPGNSESIVNPEIFYKAATAKRPALFNPYNLKIMPQVSIGECENAFPRRSIHSGVNFMDFELNEISTIDSCFVQKVYFPERKNFKYSSDTAGTRRTFRLGTKVFEAVSLALFQMIA